MLLYRESFISPFFQDDFELLAKAKPENFFIPVPDFHFHPISNQLFYFTSKALFGQNVLGFHLLLFLAFILSLWILYLVSKLLLHSDKKALLSVFFFAFNISLFAYFYWVAVSYFVLGTFFFFLTIYLYLKKNVWAYLAFLAALLSNELNFVLPGILILLSWYFRMWSKRLWFFITIDLFFIGAKLFLLGTPAEPDYKIVVNDQSFATLRWYLLRALNLPEGIRNGDNTVIFILFFALVALFLVSVACHFKTQKPNWRLFALCAAWFIVGALPFYFLPNHMSAYYLSFSLPVVAVIFSHLFWPNKFILLSSLILYLSLAFFGLDFLSHTHWTILKPSL